MSFAAATPVAWLRLIAMLLSLGWASALWAQDTPAPPADPSSPHGEAPPESAAPEGPAAPGQEPAAPENSEQLEELEPIAPAEPSQSPGPDAGTGAPSSSEPQAIDETPPAALATLTVWIRAEPPGPSAAGVQIESDDGHTAVTAEDGSASIELGPGPRVLRLSLPLALTPAHPGPDPKVIRLEGIDLGTVQRAELRVAIGPDGTPGSLELTALPPEVAPPPSEDPSLAPVPGAPERGRIVGTVSAKAGAPSIAGVSVFIEGLDAQATSDESGRFELSVPVGRHTLWVIHEDFPTLTLPNVDVRAGKDTNIRVELEAPTAATDDWVIRAQFIKGGVATLMAERRKSSAVTDSLGSEEFAKSPDSSASTATRRIVGASIVGGQFLFVRGLGGRYSNSRLNGVPLPATDPDLPGFQLDLFPAGLLSALRITKTFSPDIPGDFAGGSLNVETRGYPQSFTLSASLGISYNSETTGRRMPSYEGGSLDFLGIDDGTRALPDDLPEQQLSSVGGLNPDQVTEISRRFPNTWRLTERVALPNLSLGLSVGDTLEGSVGRFGYLLAMGYRHKYERFDETTTKVGLMGSGDDVTAVPLETLQRENGVREGQFGILGTLYYAPAERHGLTLVSLLTQNGEDRTSYLTGRTDAEGTNVRLTQMRFVERQLLFNQLLGAHDDLLDLLTVRWQLNVSQSVREQPDSRGLLYTERPNGFTFSNTSGSGERLYTDLQQMDYGGGLDLKLSLGKESAIQAGYLGRQGDRDFLARRMGVQVLASVADRTLPPEQLFAPERAGEFWRINEVTLPSDGFQAEEDLHAGYAMLDSQLFSGLRLMAGARVEYFQQRIDVAPPFELVGQTPPSGGDRRDRDYLPAAALIVAPSENMNVRAAYGGTVARPLVRELAPFLSQDFVRRRTIQGNTELTRTFIHNFDLRWELFPTATEVFAISTFYKRFEDPIESVVVDTAGNITFENIDSAQSYGAEIEARVGLGILSDALDRFSALANLALIQSSVSLSEEQRGTATRAERPLAGQSPYVANLSLGYDHEESGFSTYVYYNVFGRRIQEVGRLGLPDVYEEPFHSLDVTAFWKTKSALTLGLSASNLLLQPVRVTQGGLDFSRSERGLNLGISLGWSP